MKFDMIDWVHMFSQFHTDIWSVWLEYSSGMLALWVPSYTNHNHLKQLPLIVN